MTFQRRRDSRLRDGWRVTPPVGVVFAAILWQPGAQAQDVLRIFQEAQPNGPLAVITALEEIESELEGTPQHDLLADLLATRLTYVHDYEKALRLDCNAYSGNRRRVDRDPSLANWTPRSAVDWIVEAAEDRAVVMLNEEHRRSQQRAFAHELLEPLVDAGFTHLALETLRTDPSVVEALDERGYPLESDGTYTRDPVLGDLVRRALELGLEVVAYEAPPAPADLQDPLLRTNRREGQQAERLAALFDEAPDARLIVWCGRHHLSEQRPADPTREWTPMGGIFAERTELDPLSVDLMVMVEADAPERERPAYREAAAAGHTDEATVFVDSDGRPYSVIEGIDAMAFLPRTRIESGRPHWMQMAGVRTEVTLDLGELAPEEGSPLAVEASVDGEDAQAVPMDRVLWREGEAPSLLLRPELRYVVRVFSSPHEVVWESIVDIDDASR